MINGKNIIAVCTSRIYDNQHHRFLQQLNDYLIPYNCRIMIFALNCDLYWREDDYVAETHVFDIIPFDRLECLIYMDEKIKSRRIAEKAISRAQDNSVPVIVVDGNYENTVNVSFDYERGFESVVRHVLEKHRARKPRLVAGIKGNKFSDERIDIFRKVIEENGIAFNDSMVSYGEFWAGPARDAAQKIIDSGDIPDSVICANDIMAINVSDVFIKAGINVPEQVIVSGFDGIEEAFVSTPAISTAGCDSTDLADAVGEAVSKLISGEKITNVSVLPRLCPNASCGCEYEPPNYNPSLDTINSGFYRYQDDVKVFHEISANMQQSETVKEAASYLKIGLAHDMCCVVDKNCFVSAKNYFLEPAKTPELCVFFDAYDPDLCETPLSPDEIVPNIEQRFGMAHPLIFNAIDFMDRPFGYVCYSFIDYSITDYTKTASVTNTISIGLGGYINMRYQAFLTEKVTSELKLAAQVQMNMLPTDFGSHENYEINASMIPAKNVGGDFYDFFNIDPDHLCLIIADVSGKGVPAALFMAISKLIIHDRALLSGTPAEILRDVNEQICENNKIGLFITIWFGILDLKTGIVTYANAGHEYPAVKLGNDDFAIVRSDNLPPVGVNENMTYTDLTIDLSGGGSLFLYTDGVTDVKNENGEHFGLNRTLELLNSIDADSPEKIVSGINKGITDFGGNVERFDDTTMLCLKFKGTK